MDKNKMTQLSGLIEEISLFIIKHDGLSQKEDEYARQRIESEGLKIIREQEVMFTPEITWEFYHDKRDEKFLALREYITAGKSLAMVVSGKNCYEKLHDLKQEMRSRFIHGEVNTGTHASDNLESTIREIALLNIKF